MKPEIRFNGFSDEWVEKKLGDVFKKGGSGGTPSSSKSEYYDGGIPFLSISDLSKSDVYVNETLKSITELGLNNSAAWIVPKNAISLAMYASVGKVGILSKPMATSQAFYNMVFDSIETGMFVYQWLTNRYIMNGWRKDISTGTQPNLNAQIVKSTVIQLPTLPEQQKIGGLFSKYDAIIALREQKLAELDALKKGLLQQMFPKNGAKVPKLRFAGFADEWVEKKLGELAQFNPKTVLPDEFEYVDLESVAGTEMISHRTESKDQAPSRAQRLAQKGDVFYQTVRPYQMNNYLYDLPYDNYVFSTGYAQMRPNIDSHFLLSSVQNKQFVQHVLDRCTGTSYPAINSNDLSKIEINVPSSLPEQQKIGQLFKHLDDRISNEQAKIEQLKDQKQGLLQRMLTI